MLLQQTNSILSSIRSRTAIFIDNVIYHNKKASVVLKGTLIPESIGFDDKNILLFEITFKGVFLFESITLDNSELDSKMLSNFDIIKDSKRVKYTNNHEVTHYLLSTYDYVYQIIAEEYILKINNEIFI